MATFLDTLGVLDYFAPIFSALLVFAVVFTVLQKTKILTDSKVISSVVAIALSILVLLVPDLVELINFIAPWFVLLFIFLILLLTTYQLFGLKEENIVTYMIQDKTINWTILAIGGVIVFAGIAAVFGERALGASTDTGDAFQSNLFTIIFNPKILGLMLILGIGVFTIAFLGGGSTSNGGGGHGGGHH